ncbi:MAG TPA: hypothetical protein VMV60_03180 [Thermoanaerobaculia bacterium]|nr:hypothetical protein [Thermoanaerobaculia bacterium]
MRRAAAAVALAAGLLAAPAEAWIYPEHRNIAGSAIEGLDPARKATLERLWAEARKGHEDRLCESPWAGDQGKKPGCIDFAAFPALSGDHSCSADDVLNTILNTKWVMDVAAVASVLDKGLATAKNKNEARNRLTRSDLELQRRDPEYATRAGSNNVHFLLTRDTDDVGQYLMASLAHGAELNGLGVWARYHIAAMRLVHELEAGRVPDDKRPEVARLALAAEAFGDHFLEDAFAAGHVTGVWGDVATRKGTHDYYNQNGFDAMTWSGKPILMFGDANMKPADLARAAASLRASFDQVLDAASPDWAHAAEYDSIPIAWAKGVPAFDTCKSTKMPSAEAEGVPAGIAVSVAKESAPILLETPRPGRRPPEGAMPRFRSEIGPFIGLAAGISGGWADGGFESTESPARAAGTMDIGVRAGLGLEALLGDAGDGQIFLQAGVLQELGSKDACADPCPTAGVVANLALRTPARKAIATRIRMPFWLIPGDLILAAPILGFLAPKTYTNMAMVAASGGLIPWQTGLSTPVGRVQFILGREVGASFFGYNGGEDQLFVSTPGSGSGALTVISLRSIRWDFPIVEVRPFRSYATTQAAAVLIQIGMAFDKPTKITVFAPASAPSPYLKTTSSLYVRLAFDWRNYL